jgi:methanogenic corrinoid protein MtbC1
MTQALIDAITEMREEDVLDITHRLLDAGASPLDLLEASRQAMEVIGKRFESGECFIPELMLAGDMLAQVASVVKPRLAQMDAQKKLGKVIFGTVEGDIHDIAKDIVVFMLDINGFEVTDLGVDVAPARFIEAVKETGAKIVGLSGFLTLAYDPMKATVQALKAAGLSDVKVMIGGGQMDDKIREYTGADAYGKDAMAAVNIAKGWA